MSGLRMPTPTPVVIPKRPKLSLRDELKILIKWTALDLSLVTASERSPLKARVELLRRAVYCAGCGRTMFMRMEYQYDHEIARAISGDDRPSNLRPYCVTLDAGGMVRVGCHNLKTERDKAIIAKGARLRGEKGRRNPLRKTKKIPQRLDPWPKGKRKIRSRAFRRSP